jgi:hypothetical protein
VNPALVALGVAVSLAAVLAVSARDARVATIGLVAVLAGGPLVTEPLGDPLAVASRVIAAVLAGFLIRVALRRSPLTHGSRVGPVAELLLGSAAFVVGLAAVGVATPDREGVLSAVGPAAAVAAGAAILALAVAPLADLRDGFRAGVGVSLLLAGADLVRTGLLGPTEAIGHLVLAAVVVAIGISTALLVLRTSQAIEGASSATGRAAHRS